MNKRNNEKGAITLYVLLACLFFVFTLSGVYIANLNKMQTQEQQLKQIQDNYGKDVERIDEINENLSIVPTGSETPQNEAEIITDYGKIDIIWLNEKTTNVTDLPNKPYLYTSEKLTPVTWTYYEEGITENGQTVNWIEDDAQTTISKVANQEWYNYTSGNGTDDYIESKWANAKNIDGSYFVWIPRYAYRITYYDKDWTSDNTAKVTGYYDGYGMWKQENGEITLKSRLDEGAVPVEYNGKKYILHPAFGNSLDLGGWDGNGLTGIWVAKYEMSRSDATDSFEGSQTIFKSIPSVQSAVDLSVGDVYVYGQNYFRTKESHLMKNSEWGAIAYLTYSKFGRNGHEVDINNCSMHITGNGGGGTDLGVITSTTYKYNTIPGAKASTTGNVYGIYDISGGAWDYVAGYDKACEDNSELNNGIVFATGISTKYSTAYINGTSENKSIIKLFETGKIGDATKEISKSSEDCGWNKDLRNLIHTNNCFSLRGGGAWSEERSGIFSLGSSSGSSYLDHGFRVVLCE